jgi:large subunit ribosomal protein L29
MKMAEIRGKDSRELNLDLQQLRKELFQLRFKGASEQVAKTARFRELRRWQAQILTVLGERSRTDAGGKGRDA